MSDESPLNKEIVLMALGAVEDPVSGRSIVAGDLVRHVAICDGHVRVRIDPTVPPGAGREQLRQAAEAAVKTLPGVKHVEIAFEAPAARPAAARDAAGGAGTARAAATARAGGNAGATRGAPGPMDPVDLPGVKDVVAVGAGKGGVGKSTLSVLLATGLARTGARVGLLDADVYGPSIPKMLGLEGAVPAMAGDQTIQPIVAGGLKVISIGFFIEPDRPVIWRGPMVHGTVKQFLGQVEWGELDYLIVDLPPGTGDVPLTLAQSIPMTGAVVVCTPQAVALADAMRAARMYQQLNVDILGIVENMSYFVAPDTGREYDLFGKGGAKTAAAELGVPFLGALPINIGIRISGDAGTPEAIFRRDATGVGEEVMAVVRALVEQVAARRAAGGGAPAFTVSG